MYDNLDLQSLINLSKTNANQIKIELSKFDKVYEHAIKNVPEDQKDILEKVKILSNKAINLAKEGKQEEANKVIEELKNIK